MIFLFHSNTLKHFLKSVIIHLQNLHLVAMWKAHHSLSLLVKGVEEGRGSTSPDSPSLLDFPLPPSGFEPPDFPLLAWNFVVVCFAIVGESSLPGLYAAPKKIKNNIKDDAMLQIKFT